MSEPDKLQLLIELDATLAAIEKAVKLLPAMYALEQESPYMVKPIERVRWTIKRLGRHAFTLACQIGPAA